MMLEAPVWVPLFFGAVGGGVDGATPYSMDLLNGGFG